ncbi:hypothetical protein Rcae01_06667 [Novipirellula caenicola]|uniref:Uncharacterized protein n=1 Tax=Novipirellula caenicola TaxID=1536901 RepID=A0ABP9W1C1_9BACT
MQRANGPVQSWNVETEGALTTVAIRRRHQPNDHFRISPNSYAGGTKFPERSRAGRVYVLFGRCKFVNDEYVWDLIAPCYADLPAGGFTFSVPDDYDVMLVKVWELPSELWPPPEERRTIG